MSNKQNVITGATGLLGSHIAEQLVSAGHRVRALVRPTADTAFLKHLNVELVTGDLADPPSIRNAVRGADVVYHCAARVSDWGPWRSFQTEVIDATKNLLAACQAETVGRLLYVSTIAVYGHPRVQPGQRITEDAPLGQNPWVWDYYGLSKMKADQAAQQYPGVITIVRPGWIYGPRDRATIPRVVPALRDNRVPIIGSGENRLNLSYVGDIARGCILAATNPAAVGEIYNLCGLGELTQKQMLDTMTDALGLPRIRKHLPFSLVKWVAFLQEMFARLVGRKNPPTLTRKAIYLIARSTQYSIDKAKTQLAWVPEVHIEEGVKRTLEWYFAMEENHKRHRDTEETQR